MFDGLVARYPSMQLQASGAAVGLPDGQMGNSEVGHLTIGSGRILLQDLVRVSRAVEDGSFFVNDALVGDRRFQYILGLQEVPVMAMADGYAMASGGLGVVNLHISCGLGNAMGMLYNAYREGTPLLITAGQQDRRLMFEEPILWGQMVEVARPWTKWACEVQRIEDLPTAVRRAAQAALTPPTGPVFLSLPVDVQMQTVGQTFLSAV